MILAVCLDDKFGMSFLGRRQSRDREISAQLLSRLKKGRLWLECRSAELFDEDDSRITVTDGFPENYGREDVVFCENLSFAGDLTRFSCIWMYRWNCVYPADVRFPMDEVQESFSLSESMDFAGSSHERITLEVYERA